jgi:hypothetical protein
MGIVFSKLADANGRGEEKRNPLAYLNKRPTFLFGGVAPIRLE